MVFLQICDLALQRIRLSFKDHLQGYLVIDYSVNIFQRDS